ncbi:MAG: hypothetical protein ACI8WY_003656, partial [Planctomycetota bacterium]
SRDGYRPVGYRLPSADLLPSARSARRVGGVATGSDQAGTDMRGGVPLPSARSARRVGGVSTGSDQAGTDMRGGVPLPSARSARRVGGVSTDDVPRQAARRRD